MAALALASALALAPVSARRVVDGCCPLRWRIRRGGHGRIRTRRGKDPRPAEQPRFLGRETEVRVATPAAVAAAVTLGGSCRRRSCRCYCCRIRSSPGETTSPLGCFRASRGGKRLYWAEDAVTVRFYRCREEQIQQPPRDGGVCCGKRGIVHWGQIEKLSPCEPVDVRALAEGKSSRVWNKETFICVCFLRAAYPRE